MKYRPAGASPEDVTPDTCDWAMASIEPYGWFSSTGVRSSLKNFGDMGDARILRQWKENDEFRLWDLLDLPQRGSMPRFVRFLRLRTRIKMMAATTRRKTAAPIAMPAMAAVLSCTESSVSSCVDGSTILTIVRENTESLRPSLLVVFGLCRQPACKATRAMADEHSRCRRRSFI